MKNVIAGLCAVTLLCTGLQAFAAEKGKVTKRAGRWFETIDRTMAAKMGGTLRVNVDAAPVTVATWPETRVNVVVSKEADTMAEDQARSLFDDYEVEIGEAEGNVSVTAHHGGRRGSRRLTVSVTLKVPTNYDVDLTTSAGGIKVGDLEGNVKAITSGGGIKVGNTRNGSVDIQTSGGGLTIGSITNGNGRAVTSGGGISVGNVTGDLAVTTSGGGISLGRVDGTLKAETAGGGIKIDNGGQQVVANTAGGGIKVGESDGSVTVRTAGGGIKIGATEGDVKAETAGGSIKVGVSKGAVAAKTAGGSIKVEGAVGPVRAETAGGGIKVTGARSSIFAGTAGGGINCELLATRRADDLRCSLETSGGDVTLCMSPDLPATINARIDIKRRAGRDYRIYSALPLTIEGQGSDRIIGRGEINGGGVPIDLKTVNGDIHIKKLE